MGLDKLVGITLGRIDPDASVIKRLISAAERNNADAHVMEISAENRFDVAYKAIMQLANAALQANGYRTLTNKPGHHMTMITDSESNDWTGQADGYRAGRSQKAA